jgi:hypothetical protein
VDLSYGILRPSIRTEPIGTRTEVHFEDGFEHQLKSSLHHSVPDGGDAQAASFMRPRLGDHPLPYGLRPECAGLELVAQVIQEGLDAAVGLDRSSAFPIDASSASTLVLPDPPPCNEQESRVTDEVGKIIEPATLVLTGPSVQLGLNLQYPGFCLLGAGPRCARVHERPSGVTITALRTCCLPSPCGRLSRPQTTMQAPPPPAPTADDEPARHLVVDGRRRRVPTFTLLPIDGLGAQLCPCGLATLTPQTFGVASLPATSRPARKFPALAGARRSPAHIRQVGAGGVT